MIDNTQGSQSAPDTEHRRRFEGQLNKFTNVVKGWQYRWFVLDPESGRLEYYLLEDRNGKCRGSQHLAGAVVIPSEEDGQTFTVNLASGEMFKVRASHAKERQMWVDRLRACAHMHNQALAGNNATANMREHLSTPPGGRSLTSGEPSDQLQNLSLTALDAFGSVHDILHKVEEKHHSLASYIEILPLGKVTSIEDLANHVYEMQPLEPTCHNDQLLLLKATSQATLMCMESALTMLQEIRENQLFAPVQKTIIQTAVNLIPASPSKVSSLGSADSPGSRASSRSKSAETMSAWQGDLAEAGFPNQFTKVIKPPSKIDTNNDDPTLKENNKMKPIKETVHDQNDTKDVPNKKTITKPADENKFKSKAPTNLLLPPTQGYSKPGDSLSPIPGGQTPKSPKSLKSPRSPRSPRSPGLMRQFQAVKTGLHFVSQMKPEKAE